MDILMPQLGETVAEGKITVWFKSVGDAVKPGENLFEIETDKTSMEVPATSAGVLARSMSRPARSAPVGAVVAVVADAAGGASPPHPAPVRLLHAPATRRLRRQRLPPHPRSANNAGCREERVPAK